MTDPIEGPMVGRIDPLTGKAVLEPANSPLVRDLMDDAIKQVAIREEPENDRLKALEAVIQDKMLEERSNIVRTIVAYATDCQQRAADLEESGARERKRLVSTGHLAEAEDLKKMQTARAAAFAVRAAIAADIAYKIEVGWGRNPDGTPMGKVDTDSEDVIRDAGALSNQLNEIAAKLKLV